MFHHLRKLRKQFYSRFYHPLNRITLSKQNFINNYQYLRGLHSNIQIAPVLKSNAYGHGLNLIGEVIDQLNAPFVCVDSLYEAFELKKIRIKTPILIMGYLDPRNLSLNRLPFKYALYELSLAHALNKYQPGSAVHIFVDTGMSREGISIADLPEFIDQLLELKNIKIEGIMSHFASADESENPQTDKQIANFKLAQKICEQKGIKLKWTHLSASAGLLTHRETGCNVARVGKAVYGIDPIGTHPELKPVLSLQTKIVQVKQLEKGALVGYNGTFQAKKTLNIGVLPIGYADGVDRRLSNQGLVTVGNKLVPIIGRVSMNITTIDLTGIDDYFVGQEVTIYSSKPEAANSIKNSADLCQTIAYDLLVHLDPSIRRQWGD